jgi:two-component system chemotaxis response regulator CheY
MLDGSQFQIIGEAANAKDAINTLKDRKAHIAIVDIVMPEVSGIELTEKLSKGYKDLYVIIISSLAQENIIMDSISAGASDFLQKPFNKETLLNSLEKVASSIQEE